VASPLVGRRELERASVPTERLAALEARKEAKYREIRDAEFDFRVGKLSQADYRALDRALRREAIAILREMDELERDRPTQPGDVGDETADEPGGPSSKIRPR
jgi:hypothetical protein